MKRQDLLAMMDHDSFMDLLGRCKLDRQQKSGLILERWAYLYEQYGPDERHVSAKRDYERQK